MSEKLTDEQKLELQKKVRQSQNGKTPLSMLKEFYEKKKGEVSEAIKPIAETASKAAESVKETVGTAVELGKGYGKSLKTLYVDYPAEVIKTLTDKEEDENGK